MDQQITPTTSYKEVKIGKTIYRVTSFFSGEKELGKTLEQLAVRRAMSEVSTSASCSATRLHSHTILPALPHPCAAMDSPLRCSCREIPCGAITPHEVWNLDDREGK